MDPDTGEGFQGDTPTPVGGGFLNTLTPIFGTVLQRGTNYAFDRLEHKDKPKTPTGGGGKTIVIVLVAVVVGFVLLKLLNRGTA
jgi:hypothetical protein